MALSLAMASGNVEIDDSWLGEVGVGCGSGSRGLRAELALGLRGGQDVDGIPLIAGANPIDPLHTTVSSYTMMLNVYRDLGYWGKTVPYLGLGVGVAWNDLDDVSFSRVPSVNNAIRGNDEFGFAWSLMAGLAHQITSRAVVDVGYRYIDLGSVRSDRIDSALNQQPAVRIDDLGGARIQDRSALLFGNSRTPAAYIQLRTGQVRTGVAKRGKPFRDTYTIVAWRRGTRPPSPIDVGQIAA